MQTSSHIPLNSAGKIYLLPLLYVAALLLFSKVRAQTGNALNAGNSKTVNEQDTISHDAEAIQKDIGDVISSLFRKPRNTAKTLQTISTTPVFSGVPAIGYTLQTKLAAVISGNVAFRISPEANISTISGNVTYTQNKQFYVPITSNISLKGNRYRFVGEFRFYKYPQSTFGLGSAAPIGNEDPMDYTYIRFYETALKKLKGHFYAGAGYNLDYHWNISHKGNKNGTPSDYAKYENAKRTLSSGVNLTALYDSRDNPISAKRGLFTNVVFRNNFRALGSNNNWKSLTVDVRKYFLFPRRSRNVLGFWSYNTIIISGKPPYLDLPSTGWDSYNNSGRGFIQGRYRGSKMVYLETEYRFRLTSNGLLGGVVYANEESFAAEPGTKLQAFQLGYGTGLRVKINKLSNTNLGIDYAFGTQGSKGLFITVGEIF